MKLNLLVLGCLISVAPAFAADASAPAPTSPPPAATTAKPELRGMLAIATEKRFNLSIPGSGHSEWVRIGESFGEWKLMEFKNAEQTLILRRGDGAELELSLSASQVTAGEIKATAADGEAVLEKMKFGKIMESALAPQKKIFLEAVRKIAAKAGLSAASGDTYADYQKKASDLISSAFDPKQMEGEVAQIYSNVYSKDELSGLGDFFDSPVGQVYAANAPQVQQQLQAVMIPRLMAIVPQLQSLAKQAATPAAPPPP